jgi:hypothetical protein
MVNPISSPFLDNTLFFLETDSVKNYLRFPSVRGQWTCSLSHKRFFGFNVLPENASLLKEYASLAYCFE